MSLMASLFQSLGRASGHGALPRCAGCGKAITGIRLEALDQAWHPEHFRCGICDRALGGRFNLSPHQEPFCLSHGQDKAICPCCGHLIPGRSPALGFCPGCSADILMDTKDAEEMLKGIQAHLRREGLPWWPQAFPVRLVSPGEMQPQSCEPGASLVGLISKVTSTDSQGRKIRQIPEIRLLQGRPSLLQGAVIAHELGHAWIFVSFRQCCLSQRKAADWAQ